MEMTKDRNDAELTIWNGMYKKNWQGVICEEAFRHPAKFSRSLINQIYLYLFEKGYIKKGDTILDPFGGVSLGSLDAANYGLQWVGIELEGFFRILGHKNILFWIQEGWCICGEHGAAFLAATRASVSQSATQDTKPDQAPASTLPSMFSKEDDTPPEPTPEPITPDESAPQEDSPSLINRLLLDNLQARQTARSEQTLSGSSLCTICGKIKVLLPVLLQGDSRNLRVILGQDQAHAVLGSPPFASSLQQTGGSQGKGTYAGTDLSISLNRVKTDYTDYGTSPGQLGAMPAGDASAIISSPPYAASLHTNESREADIARMERKGTPQTGGATGRSHIPSGSGNQGYVASEGQLAALPEGTLSGMAEEVSCVLTSPPYGAGVVHGGSGLKEHADNCKGQDWYGTSEGQLGNLPGANLDLASTINDDRMYETNHCLGESGWHNAEIVERQLQSRVDGVSHVVESMSVLPLKEDQNLQATEGTLPLLDLTSQLLNVGESLTPTGAEVPTVGEAMHGESNDELLFSATDTPASNVAGPPSSRSTTKKTKTKRVANGITTSTISKPSVQDAISPIIEQSQSLLYAPSVENKQQEEIEESVALMPVEQKSTDVPIKNLGKNTQSNTPASNVESSLLLQGADLSIAHRPALAGQETSNVGYQEQDTFWKASSTIVSACVSVLKPGGVTAWVLKDYVSKKKRVRFCDQWRQLCEMHGLRLVEEIHASLVEEHGVQEGLFGSSERVFTKKASFFRRLAEKKGSPSIDYEVVLIMVKDNCGV